ncbi:asparaginase [Ruania halotolerans]|uniref:asparaginase n=1 Tax=Ruania halotolerans TaxID=2897773 RepID=UPI001E31454C|nr:asparaginase [Ruania halotolerans]UFU05916.1 asparaginase [Ruania halotolerans]
MTAPPTYQAPSPGDVLAWVIRGTLIESVHTGHLLAVSPDGGEVLRLGDPDQELYARSSLKPLQAVGMLRAGVRLDDAQLALACASHNGEPRHREVALGILASVGLDAGDLDNTADLPLDPAAAADWRAQGNEAAPITQNCSGKHAAMLATCVAAGWSPQGYRDPDHPLQRHLVDTVAELTGEPVRHVAVDGCGAPQPSSTVRGLARGFARLATADADSPEHRVAEAMRANPFLVAGTGRDATAAMRAVPGLIAKDGADGVYAAALPDGATVAFKISDGGARPRPAVLAAGLRLLGVHGDWPWAQVPVLGYGQPVGSVLAAFGPHAPALTHPGVRPGADPGAQG